ncbi:MAG: hypothetical protein ACK42L_02685 [Thermoanaerobaculum sp.]
MVSEEGGEKPMMLAGLLLLSGWGWAALAEKGKPTLGKAVVGAVACCGGWFLLLALIGIRWQPWLAALPLLVGLALAFLHVGTLRLALQSRPAHAVAAVVALVAVSRLPAWGWDFRYQWGLKAKVFTAFGGFASAWLANPEVSFANPHYPPLWPTLLAFAMHLGHSAEHAAGMWTSLLRVGLASACWSLAFRGEPWQRWLAAALGFLAPVLFRPFFSGYAEPLLAFLLASAVVVTTSERGPSTGPLWGLYSLLGLAKGEGLLWLACLGAVGWRRWEKPQRLAFLLSFLPALAWFSWALRNAPGTGVVELIWERFVPRLLELPSALLHAGPEALLAVLAFGLAVLASWGHTPLAKASLGFAFGLAVVYLAGPYPLPWWLANSLVRVLAVPVPALLASGLVYQKLGPLAPPGEPAA